MKTSYLSRSTRNASKTPKRPSLRQPVRAGRRLIAAIDVFAANRQVLCMLLVSLLYFVLLQRKFLFRGDVWAETHMEYLDRALTEHTVKIFQAGWAGYLEIIPASLAKIYKLAHLPLGYIDIYYKLVDVTFVLLCVALSANTRFRALFRSKWTQMLFCFLLLLILRDISVFSFINIWYIGFVPIILASLSATKFSHAEKFIYVPFTVLVALTKPSQIILPFLIYKTWRTKQYVSDGIMIAAVLLQTAVMMFFDPKHVSAHVNKNIIEIVQAVFVGGATECFKLIRIVPHHFIYLLLANILLATLLYLIARRKGILIAGLLLFGYAYSVYGFVLPPDTPLNIHDFVGIYNFSFKMQREVMIHVFILLILLIGLSTVQLKYLERLRLPATLKLSLVPIGIAVGGILLVLRVFLPINVEAAGQAANIDTFRSAMNSGQSVCVPIPPTPAYAPHANWVLSFNTFCNARNFELNPDFAHMNTSLTKLRQFEVPNDTPLELKTVYVVIKNTNPRVKTSFQLIDTQSGIRFTGIVPARSSETVNFIPINVAGMPFRTIYDFALYSPYPNLKWGTFQNNKKPLYYPYFGETRPVLTY